MAIKTLTSKNTNFKENSELDSIQGSEIADSIFGGIGADSLFGNSGNDTIGGGNDNDVISGGADDDSLMGGNGNDSVSGDDGNDTLDGGMGADSMVGGNGDDTYYVDNIGDVIIESSASKGGNDTVFIINPLLSRHNFSQFVGIEDFFQEAEGSFGDGLYTEDTSDINTIESSKTITIGIPPYKTVKNLFLTGNKLINGTGNDNDNLIKGNDNNNKLNGGKGDDTLIGNYGDDTLIGGSGDNVLDGGDGDDVVVYNGFQSDFDVEFVDGLFSSVINIKNDTVDELKDIEYVSFNDYLYDISEYWSGSSLGDGLFTSIISKDVTVVEGNENGSTKAMVLITLNIPFPEDITVELSTEDGTAIDGDDYEALNAETITFAAGQTSRTIPINIISDSIFEDDENFFVIIDNLEGGGYIDEGKATVTITNDDKPNLSIVSTVTVTEGEKGKSNAEMTVSLSSPVFQEVTVNYKTTDGTAKSTGLSPDFTNTKGTLTFKAGETTQKISLPINDDKLAESDENFTVTLSGAKGALLDTKNAKATVTIKDNDSGTSASTTRKPTISVTAPSKVFEDSDMQFTISLSQKSTKTVSVKYTTIDGSAIGDEDFGAISATAIFKAGETKKVISIPVFQDDLAEKAENFSFQLSSPKEATLNVSSAKVTIADGEGFASNSSALMIIGVSPDVIA